MDSQPVAAGKNNHPNREDFMTVKTALVIPLLLVILALVPGRIQAYTLMLPEDLKARLDAEKPPIIVDIQPKNGYNERHFYGSVRTFAYPAKTERDTDSLVQAVRMYNATGNTVVIVGPRGGKAEERTVDFLVSRGILEEKLSILKGGINGWPHQEILLRIEGGYCY